LGESECLKKQELKKGQFGLMDDTVIPVSRPKSNYEKGRFMGYLGERI